MTDYEFLNDSSELKFSLDVARAALEAIDLQRYALPMASFIAEWRESLLLEAATCRLYVTSFSEDGDNLSLWRGYAAAGGVSIGFRRELLALSQMQGIVLGRVIYSPEEQLRLLDIVTHLHLLSRSPGLYSPGPLGRQNFGGVSHSSGRPSRGTRTARCASTTGWSHRSSRSQAFPTRPEE